MIHPDLYGTRTLIFDMDGTLINSAAMAVYALRRALEKFYHIHQEPAPSISDQELIGGLGAPTTEFYVSLLPDKHKPQWEQFRDLVQVGEHEYLSTHRITYAGVIGTLKEFRRRGYKTAIASNCDRLYLDSVLDTQGLRSLIDLPTCIGDYPGATKASCIADILKASPGKAALIGDRHYDVAAAKANSIPAVGALYGVGGRDELQGTSTWVLDPRHLLHLFNPLQEAAELVADEINSRRINERPIIAAISAPHPVISVPFVEHLVNALTELNVVVSHIPLERHRLYSTNHLQQTTHTGRVSKADIDNWINSAYPWSWVQTDLLDGAAKGSVDTTLESNSSRAGSRAYPYRGRGGSVILVEGSFLLRKPLSDRFDYTCWLHAGHGQVKQSLKKVEDPEGDLSFYDRQLRGIIERHVRKDRPESSAQRVIRI